MKVKLRNFKQHSQQEIELNYNSILYGANGAGKTSILEALELYFSESHTIYADLIRNTDEDSEITKLFTNFLENKTYRHDFLNYHRFGDKKGSFYIACYFLDKDGNECYVEKKYKSNGEIELKANFNSSDIGIIKEYFNYEYIYIKKSFFQTHLSKGEVAIKFMLDVIYKTKNSISRLKKTLKDKELVHKSSKRYLLIALDEPDNKIHPIVWRELYNELLSFDINTIITTTNLYNIKNYNKYKVNFFIFSRKKESNKFDTVIDKISDQKEIYNSQSFKEIYPNKKYLFVEGKSDKKFFDIVLQNCGYTDITVISLDGQDKAVPLVKLQPLLEFLRKIYEINPCVYAIFDYDKAGFKYAADFAEYMPKENIYFMNRRSYLNVSDWDMNNDKYLLENYLKKKYIKEATYKDKTKDSTVKYLLNRTANPIVLKCNDFKMKDVDINQFKNELGNWLSKYFDNDDILIKEKRAIKNKSGALFTDENKINIEKLNANEYNALKKFVRSTFGEPFTPFSRITENKNSKVLSEIKRLKVVLEIPDYIIKINTKSIEYIRGYNYYEFNRSAKTGVISDEVKTLLELLSSEGNNSISEIQRLAINSKDEDFLHTSISSVVFKGEEFEVSNWRGILKVITEKLYAIDPSIMQGFIGNTKFNGRKKKYFANTEAEISGTCHEVNSKLYIEVGLSPEQIRKLLRIILDEYGIKYEELVIQIN